MSKYALKRHEKTEGHILKQKLYNNEKDKNNI